ncbi:hypothetical protein Scep_016690 [Stephania cephalantha]|uniref:Uncharacterized protein n=1 Tax=Stephania cephalantha TaxID=152367 RepID=A0AAP0NSW0_9MAGN
MVSVGGRASLPLKPSSSVVAASKALVVCRRCLRSPLCLPSWPLNPLSSAVAASEALAVFRRALESSPSRRRALESSPSRLPSYGENLSKFLISILVFLFLEISLDAQRSVRKVAELYGSEKSFVTNTSETPPTMNEVYLHLHTVNHDGVTFIDTRLEQFYAKLQRRRQELTQATPDQPVDDEAVYFNVVGECPKGRVYGLRSLGRKNRRYADPGASTSQLLEMVPRSEFDSVVEQLRLVVAFM